MAAKGRGDVSANITNKFQPTTDLVTAAAIHKVAELTGENPSSVAVRILRMWAHGGGFADEVEEIQKALAVVEHPDE